MKHDKIFRTSLCCQRSDGMQVFLSSRTVYIDLFTKLSSCMFERCPFYGLTCNKCCHCCVL